MLTKFISVLLLLSSLRRFQQSKVIEILETDFEEHPLKKLVIQDVNQSSLRDFYPVYYRAYLELTNYNISILFARALDYGLQNSDFSRSYRAVDINVNNKQVDVSDGRSVLYMKTNSYFIIRSLPEKDARRWFFNRNKEILDLFGIDLTLTLDHDTILRVSSDFSRDQYLYHIERQLRAVAKKNMHLNVEACVFIHQPIYELVKNFLQTDNLNYIQSFLWVRFSEITLNIDKIYASISQDWSFRISVVLSHIFVETETNHQPWEKFTDSNYKDTGRFLNHVNSHVKKFIIEHYESETIDSCDHIFFFHNYRMGRILGLAFLNQICNDDEKASANLFLNMPETIMAHELGHNLGAQHDTDKSIKNCTHHYNLMYPSALYIASTYIISECSIKQFYKHLFKNDTILPKYQCLVELKNTRHIKDRKTMNSLVLSNHLPGYIYSISDQCRFVTNDSSSYFCSIGSRFEDCSLNCAVNGVCTRQGDELLDGTSCGLDRICIFGKCEYIRSVNGGHKIWRLKETPETNLIKRASKQLRGLCPSGPTNEIRALGNLYSELNESLGDANSCEYAIYHTSHQLRYERCSNDDPLFYICCEKCLHYRLSVDRNQTPLMLHAVYRPVQRHSYKTCESFPNMNPCFNKGKCVSEKSKENSQSFIGFKCFCKPGFSGPLCLSVDSCNLDPCEDTETCVQFGDLGEYICVWKNHERFFNSSNQILNNPLVFEKIIFKRFVYSILVSLLASLLSFFIFVNKTRLICN